MDNNKIKLDIKSIPHINLKLATCVLLIALFYPLLNLLSDLIIDSSWSNLTRNVGDIFTISALIIAGVFFQGRNNKKLTYVVACLFFSYTYLYSTIAPMLLDYPYIGIWTDTFIGLSLFLVLVYFSYIECFVYKFLGQKGVYPKKMMEMLSNHGTTNFYFSILFIYGMSMLVDIILIPLFITAYGIANSVPFDGSFYGTMIENGDFIVFSNHKLFIYDIRDLFQMFVNILFSIIILYHVIRDQTVPDEIGFNNKGLADLKN